ncbi:MAG: NADPH-dependent reductase [Bacillota bacterium]|nr:NADPH-dependent reductase [Bacillota bacterium]
MKSIVAFVGSAKHNGNIDSIVKKILEGAKENESEIKIYYLNDMNIKYCQGCLYCRKNDTCCINDDMKPVYENLKTADIIIIGSPVYMCQVSAQTKTLLDRLYPLTEINMGKHIPRFGEKQLIMVYSQAAPFRFMFSKYFSYLSKSLKGIGFKEIKRIVAVKAFTPEVSANNMKLMKEAYKIGQLLK